MEKDREVAAAILDVFENFLNEKGINIPNDEKDGDEIAAILYGTDYFNLEDAIVRILKED